MILKLIQVQFRPYTFSIGNTIKSLKQGFKFSYEKESERGKYLIDTDDLVCFPFQTNQK